MNDPLREAGRWLTQARVDLDAARVLRTEFSSLACFHCQQSAEKALKAILYGSGERPVLGHSLAELGARASLHSPTFSQLQSAVAKLDRYYIPTRYPNGLPEGADPSTAFDEEDAEAAISVAAAALAHAGEFLEGISLPGG
ncbi:MAG: HEPN domain-containing protein [Actinomycetota bacterium]